MSLPASILLASPQIPATAGNACALRVYGAQDDPLRLTVLLADHLGRALPQMKDTADACRSPRSPWRKRLEALTDLLREARTHASHYAVLVDLDGLRDRKPSWEDRTSFRMREDLRKVLLRAVDDGGWLVARPNPQPAVDEEIESLRLEVGEPSGTAPLGDPTLAPFASDVRPIVAWLVETRRIASEQVADILEEVKEPNAYVVSLAYDALPERARRTARALSLVRAPSHANGSFGRFAWADEPQGPTDVRRAEVAVLEQAGFLVRDDARKQGDLVMPRRARSFIEGIARAVDPSVVSKVHAALADSTTFEDEPVESQIEIHHHAARTGDVALTRSTARYFGFELRTLATELSKVHHNYAGAATLFRELVDNFDSTDAYAWEYLGYNLALANRKPGEAQARSILQAYERAHQLDSQNPLYFGRLLGFRAERNLPFRTQFEGAMQQYASVFGAENYVSWFVMPVFDGLKRARRKRERDELLRSWRSLLERCAPEVLEKHGPAGV